jgi:hypothetical protein
LERREFITLVPARRRRFGGTDQSEERLGPMIEGKNFIIVCGPKLACSYEIRKEN